jgi:hypothetical protein
MLSSTRHIRLGRPIVANRNRVIVPIDVSTPLKKYVGDHFYFEYDASIEAVPPQLCMVSAAANLIPLAWAFDAELILPLLDTDFYRCLPDVKRGLANMFSELDFAGQIHVDELVETPREPVADASVALFSGGVDSLHTALRHSEEQLTLASIWGLDVRTASTAAWNRSRQRIVNFATRNQMGTSFIKTNARETVNERLVSLHFKDRIAHWWLVSIGMALLGITAPLTWLTRAARVYLPAGATNCYPWPIGYHPTIDNHVRWARTTCASDGYEADRVEKLRLVSMRSPGEDMLVCRLGGDVSGQNCSRCEKCIRTMVGLLISGVNPNQHGFRLGPRTLSDFCAAVDRNAFTFKANTTYYWLEIQRRVSRGSETRSDEWNTFLDWLQTQDFQAVQRRSEVERPFRKRLRSVVGPLVPGLARKPARRLYYSIFRDL